MKNPAVQPSRLSPISSVRRRGRAVAAVGLFAAGLGLAPAAAHAGAANCALMLAVAIDFQRADGADPLRQATVTRNLNASPTQDHATGGPVPLTKVSARLGDGDGPVDQAGLSRFGLLTPYAFCGSGVSIEDQPEGGPVVQFPASWIRASDGAQGAAGAKAAEAAAETGGAATGVSAMDTDPGASLAPSGFPGELGESMWPSFIGDASRGPASGDTVRGQAQHAAFEAAGFAAASGVDLPQVGFPDGFQPGRDGQGDASTQPFDPSGALTPPAGAGLAAAAPEPMSWMLLISGFAALGGALRRRRLVAARA